MCGGGGECSHGGGGGVPAVADSGDGQFAAIHPGGGPAVEGAPGDCAAKVSSSGGSNRNQRIGRAWHGRLPRWSINGHPCRTADVQDSVPSTCPVPLVPIVPHFRGRSIRSGRRAAGEFCTFFGGVIHRTPTSEARIRDSGASFFGHPAGKCPELAVDPSRGSGLQSCRMAANWMAAKKKERRFRQESRSVSPEKGVSSYAEQYTHRCPSVNCNPCPLAAGATNCPD